MSTMTESSVRTGVVYALYRADLNKCYVGQSISFKRRMNNHVEKTERYIHQELWADGTDPEVVVLHDDVAEHDLDERERVAMRTAVGQGWDLINRLGPDEHWPHVPREISVAVGNKVWPQNLPKMLAAMKKYRADPRWAAKIREASRIRAKKTQAAVAKRRAEDPAYDKWYSDICAENALNMATARVARAERDPDFAAQVSEWARSGQVSATAVKKDNWINDPESLEKFKKKMLPLSVKGGRTEGSRAARDIRQCGECELTTNRGALGRHQSATGHKGFVQVSTYLTAENTNPMKKEA